MNREVVLWCVLVLVVLGVGAAIYATRRPPLTVAPDVAATVGSASPEPIGTPDRASKGEGDPGRARAGDGPPIGTDPDLFGLPPGRALEVQVLRTAGALPPGDQDLERTARRLLSASATRDRVEGAAILAELGRLNPADLEGLAVEEDPSVPLTVVGWLDDGGYLDLKDQLLALLSEAGWGPEELYAELRSQDIGPAARRALAEHLAVDMDPAAAQRMFRSLAAQPEVAYETRLHAAAFLAGTMEIDAYRQTLQTLRPAAGTTSSPPASPETEVPLDPQDSGAASDQLWEGGLTRLAERNQYPPGLYQGTPPLTVHTIQEGLSVVRPTTLTDLATHVDYALTREDLQVQTGTSDDLEGRLAAYEEAMPELPDAEIAALRRLRGCLERIRAVEEVTGSQVAVDVPPL